jgi:hypothetical protein
MNHTKIRGELRCSGRLSSPCSTSGTRRKITSMACLLYNVIDSYVFVHANENRYLRQVIHLEKKAMISIFPLWTFHWYVTTFQYYLHLEYMHLSWYSKACSFYQDFLDKGLMLTRNLLHQWFLLDKLKSSLRKVYGRHYCLVNRYGTSVSQMITDIFHLS